MNDAVKALVSVSDVSRRRLEEPLLQRYLYEGDIPQSRLNHHEFVMMPPHNPTSDRYVADDALEAEMITISTRGSSDGSRTQRAVCDEFNTFVRFGTC